MLPGFARCAPGRHRTLAAASLVPSACYWEPYQRSMALDCGLEIFKPAGPILRDRKSCTPNAHLPPHHFLGTCYILHFPSFAGRVQHLSESIMAPQACCGADSSQNPPLQPYSDISGTGVIVSFIGSACLVLVLLIGNYLACFDPTANPFALDPDSSDAACSPGAPAPDPMSSDNSANWWRPNRVDCWFLGRVRRKRGPWRNAKKAFVECITDMSDVQLLTGLAVLVSGFFSLQCGSPNGPPISAYHWQMVVNLAWFSIIVHLASLSVLRTHLRRSPRMRLLRFTLSLLLLVLLLVAIGPTAFFNWRGSWINSKIGAAGFVYDLNTSFSVSAANMSLSAICYFDFSYGFSKFNQISSELSIKFLETLAA
ncbi:hypothetical protein RB597_007263 [Gaeumannomyces tritici]